MRLSVYYKPKQDEFVVKYTEEHFQSLPLLTYNHYGHIVIQYIYIVDHKVFWNYESYKKYIYKATKANKKPFRYILGQRIIKFGKYLCFGKEEKVKAIYVYKYPWWKK